MAKELRSWEEVGLSLRPDQAFICPSATAQRVPSGEEMFLRRQRIPDAAASHRPAGHLRLKCFLPNQKAFLPCYLTASFPPSSVISLL